MNPEDQTHEVSLEVMAPSAIQALEKAHIDIQISTAHQYPRSIAIFKKRAMDMATLDEETAESCCYQRPVGKEFKEGREVMKYAEGMSIRMAEIVAASYGNIRVASRIVEQTERYVKCQGVAHDLETNYAGTSEVMMPTVKKNGQPFSEGQRVVVAQACLAKSYRDAIFKVVPRALAKAVYDRCKKIASGEGKPIEFRRQKVREWLKSIKVEEARVFAALDVKGWEDVGETHLEILTGLRTSMKDGDTTPEEAFPPVNPPSNQPATGRQVSAKAPQKPQDAPQGVNTAPTPANATPEPSGASGGGKSEPVATPEPTPEQPEQASKDEAEEAAAGLAPEQPYTPDPIFTAKQADSPELAAVKARCVAARVTHAQLMGYLVSKGLAKANQKLTDLSSTKLASLDANFATHMPAIQASPA